MWIADLILPAASPRPSSRNTASKASMHSGIVSNWAETSLSMSSAIVQSFRCAEQNDGVLSRAAGLGHHAPRSGPSARQSLREVLSLFLEVVEFFAIHDAVGLGRIRGPLRG